MLTGRAKRIVAGLVIFLLIFSLSACSSGTPGAQDTSMAGGGMASDNVAYAPAPNAPSYPSSTAPLAPNDMGAPEVDYGSSASTNTSADDGTGFVDVSGSVQDGRKITFSASYSINTKNFDADYAKINDIIVNAGGYVSYENTTDYSSYGRNQGRQSYLTALVPADGYNSFLDKLSGIGDVTDKSKSSQDLTSQYFDTQARIDMLEIRKERLMGYLVDAKDAADIVAFEKELSDVLYELDQYQGTQRQLDQLVSFATVNINLTELITPETIGKDGEPLGSRASDAFGLSMNGVGNFLQGVVVFFAGAAPVIVLLAVIALIIWLIVRATRPFRERQRAVREERAKKKAQARPPQYSAPYWQQSGYQPAPPYGQPQTPEPQTQPVPPEAGAKPEAAPQPQTEAAPQPDEPASKAEPAPSPEPAPDKPAENSQGE